jgi:hypothetical protein
MRSAAVVAFFAVSTVAAAADVPKAAPTAGAPKEALPFIEDDYGRAVAEAKQRKLPIFVDAWAPW